MPQTAALKYNKVLDPYILRSTKKTGREVLVLGRVFLCLQGCPAATCRVRHSDVFVVMIAPFSFSCRPFPLEDAYSIL